MTKPVLFNRVLCGMLAILLFGCTQNFVFAQEEDVDLLADLKAEKPKVVGTYNAHYLVNSPTNETAGRHEFLVNFAHRFGAIAGPTSAGYESMWGLYQVYDIRMALDFGLTDRLMIGTAANKIGTRYDGSIRYKLLFQRAKGFPVSVTLFLNAAISTQKESPVSVYYPNTGTVSVVSQFPNTTSRMSFLYQVILARKFSKRFSMSLVPTLLHRNYIYRTDDNNDIFALAVGSRFQVTKAFALTADYYQNFNGLRLNKTNGFNYLPPIGAGFEIIAGGHVFQILMSNTAVLPNEFFVNSPNDWGQGQMSFGFNLIRSIGLHKKKIPATPN